MEEEKPDYGTKKYFKIGEVAAILDVAASTIRFWEKEFNQLKPFKNKKGDRIYSLKDIETLKEIKYLTRDKGIKISKASKKIKTDSINKNHKELLAERLLNLRNLLLELKKSLDE